MHVYSMTSRSGVIESIMTEEGIYLERAVPGEVIRKGDWLLYQGREPYEFIPSQLYQVKATTLLDDPIVNNRWGYKNIMRKGLFTHFVESVKPQAEPPTYQDGDLVVILDKTFTMKGFEVGDVVEIKETDVSVLHEYMVTRYDGAVGFVNSDMIRQADEGERDSYKLRRVLLKVGRTEGDPQVNDVVQVKRGEYEGTLARIEKTCMNDCTVKLRGIGWLPLRHVSLVAPAEATVH